LLGRRQDWMFITEFYICHATLSELRQINSANLYPRVVPTLGWN